MSHIILLMILIYLNSTNAGDLNCETENETTKSHFWQNKPKQYAETLCENMGYPKKNPIKLFEKSDPGFDNCVDMFEPILKETKIEEVDAQNFGKYCKRHKLNATVAKNLIQTLKPYCWKMSDVSKLPTLIDYNIVKITPNDWKNLQSESMQLELCLDDLKSTEKNKDGSSLKILDLYKTMFIDGVSKCNCVEIIGFDNIFYKLNGNVEFDNLRSFYEKMCFKSVKTSSFTKRQLEAISKYKMVPKDVKSSGRPVTLNRIATFLIIAEQLGLSKCGWYTEYDKNTEWPLLYLMKNSEVDDRFDLKIISTMTAAISNGYSTESYDEFIQLTGMNKSIGTWKCRKRLLSAFNLDKGKLKSKDYVLQMYGNSEEANKTANKLLKLFLDLTPPSTTCMDFVNDVKDITDMFYNGIIFYKGVQKRCEFLVSHNELNTFLAASKSAHKKLNHVFNCLKLIESVDKAFDPIKKDVIGNSKQMSEFQHHCFRALLLKDLTKKIFEYQYEEDICRTSILNITPEVNKADILKLYKKLYKVESEFNDLSEIFEFTAGSTTENEGHIALKK